MAKFSKGHYILIMEALYKALYVNHAPLVREGILNAAGFIADALEADNRQFNHAHFMAVVKGEKDAHSRP
jgi:hypothetical protein